MTKSRQALACLHMLTAHRVVLCAAVAVASFPPSISAAVQQPLEGSNKLAHADLQQGAHPLANHTSIDHAAFEDGDHHDKASQPMTWLVRVLLSVEILLVVAAVTYGTALGELDGLVLELRKNTLDARRQRDFIAHTRPCHRDSLPDSE